MAFGMYAASVPAYQRQLTAISKVLDKAQAWAAAKKVDEAVLLSDRIVMLTNGPNATIGEILEVDLPRPRDRLKLAHDARFVAARASVLEFLHARHAQPTV